MSIIQDEYKDQGSLSLSQGQEFAPCLPVQSCGCENLRSDKFLEWLIFIQYINFIYLKIATQVMMMMFFLLFWSIFAEVNNEYLLVMHGSLSWRPRSWRRCDSGSLSKASLLGANSVKSPDPPNIADSLSIRPTRSTTANTRRITTTKALATCEIKRWNNFISHETTF